MTFLNHMLVVKLLGKVGPLPLGEVLDGPVASTRGRSGAQQIESLDYDLLKFSDCPGLLG
jgi:hypothetical protein